MKIDVGYWMADPKIFYDPIEKFLARELGMHCEHVSASTCPQFAIKEECHSCSDLLQGVRIFAGMDEEKPSLGFWNIFGKEFCTIPADKMCGEIDHLRMRLTEEELRAAAELVKQNKRLFPTYNDDTAKLFVLSNEYDVGMDITTLCVGLLDDFNEENGEDLYTFAHIPKFKQAFVTMRSGMVELEVTYKKGGRVNSGDMECGDWLWFIPSKLQARNIMTTAFDYESGLYTR